MTFDKFSAAEMVASSLASEISGKVVIVTGCTVGSLGTEVAKAIASSGARVVIISGRSESKLKESVGEIRKSSTSNCELRPLIMDLSSLKSVKLAAQQVIAYAEDIDVLINNAGIMAHSLFRTEDGFEGQFGTNHLGPFLFTTLLLKKLSPNARIINVSSYGHLSSDINWDDPNYEHSAYDKWKAYGQAKTANILFAKELSKRGFQAFSLHPGAIQTKISNHLDMQTELDNGFTDASGKPLKSITELKSLSQGAATHIVAAFDPSIVADNGGYLTDCQIANNQAARYAMDPDNASKLWLLSESLVNRD